jgi:hypothetical protein
MSPGAALAKIRWAGTTKAERRAHMAMMHKFRKLTGRLGGRPRKASTEVVEIKTPKRRGRPRKNQLENNLQKSVA